MVSAELALTVPAVLLVLAICLTALSLGVDQVRCEDAARVAARAASRGGRRGGAPFGGVGCRFCSSTCET